ncbi:MAG: PepSY-like domain-containing protein [Salinivirgaceae bacterium]
MIIFNCWAGEPIPIEKIPNKVKSFINLHYPDQNIVKSGIDKELFSVTYEILLSNQVSLDFNEKCDVIEIDGNTELPESTICTTILTYVNINYPNNYITGWKLKKYRQQIELDNDLDLVFDNNGDFKGFDN